MKNKQAISKEVLDEFAEEWQSWGVFLLTSAPSFSGASDTKIALQSATMIATVTVGNAVEPLTSDKEERR